MKITIDIDCTPDEARDFFGLPDVRPLQETLMKELQDRLRANMNTMDPEALLKTWLPAGFQGFEQLQRTFWNQMASAMNAATNKDKPK